MAWHTWHDHDVRIGTGRVKVCSSSIRKSTPFLFAQLDEADLIGDVQCIMIGCQTDVRLLFTIRSDEGVHLGSLDIVQLLNSILNLTLVRLDINDEHEGVVLFDLLHRRFRVEG